ncbi:MAG: class I SAM-dependent methyltransferase [Candidatus Aenigmatarchaeota archaeon]
MKFNCSEKIFWEIRNKIYSFFLKNFVPYNELIENIINELDPKPGFYILDAGCGAGIFERKLIEKGIPNLKVEAIDVSDEIIRAAKRNNPHSNNIIFRVMDLNGKLEFKDRTFDAIVCINVLYLLKKPLNTLLEFYRILKAGGKIILAIPKYNFNYVTLFRMHFLKRRGLKKIRDAIIFPLVLVIILPFELFITMKERKGGYHRFRERDIIELFRPTPFKYFRIMDSYAGQNFFIIVKK